MIPVDMAWEKFQQKNLYNNIEDLKPQTDNLLSPKCSDIYISTKTKISYLNHSIRLGDIFWAIPILNYQTRKEGVIKKQMKINCLNKKEVEALEQRVKDIYKQDICIDMDILPLEISSHPHKA